MKKNESEFGWTFTAQKGKRLLAGDDNKKRNTYVDIYAENDKDKIILDTKYKIFTGTDDFSNADGTLKWTTSKELRELFNAELLNEQ